MASSTSPNSQLYQYTKLPPGGRHFRLVTVNPPRSPPKRGTRKRRADGGIYGRIMVVDIESCGQYDALSYCWSGHTDPSQPAAQTQTQAEPRCIVVETQGGQGKEGGRAIPITPSLGMALRYLRDRGQERPIFIDQICINQDDVDERSAQVALMGQIYTKSECVLGWLGPATKQSKAFMGFVARLSVSAILDKVLGRDDPSYRHALRKGIEDGVPADTGDAVLDDDIEDLDQLLQDEWGFQLRGMLDVLSRPWFRRMWIVQEACLPSRLVFLCGQQSCSVSDFEKMSYVLTLAASLSADRLSHGGTSAIDVASPLRRVFGVRKVVRRLQEGSTVAKRLYLSDLAMAFNAMDGATAKRKFDTKFRATDSRDCIYGLFGLAEPTDPVIRTLVPDYSTPPQLVFADFAKHAVKENIDLLLYSSTISKSLPGLPSWVPDWSAELVLPAAYKDAGEPFFCAGRSGPTAPASPDSSLSVEDDMVLVATGVLLDRVHETGKCWLEPSSGAEDFEPTLAEYQNVLGFCNEVQSFCKSARRKHSSVSNPIAGGLDKAVWLTATGGLGLVQSLDEDIFGPDVDGQPFLGFLYDKLIEVARDRTGMGMKKKGRRRVEGVSHEPILLDAMYKQVGRRCFVTPKGYFGLGPLTMKPGDEVVILHGLSSPIILRPGQGTQPAYTYVGEAYCHGFMHGEIFGGTRGPVTVFRIC
ncbi:heterokaryon incompatibility protein-domain-containing protein [Lasiosphaeris hirsuta]|uniref:Heterokaryon incompatibility protein-domain-containing protein n=1 Tax=Lasiosphaeris hirsuta TaxID=260670 RepID=A0AA40DKM7_9PEZI|nr:heterokaryon incompatibility protein-domain-containing protein [Lasiosphaeris hirsuta]